MRLATLLMALAAVVVPARAVVGGPRARTPLSVSRRVIVLYSNDTPQSQIADVRAAFGEQFPAGALALSTDATGARPLTDGGAAGAVAGNPAVRMDLFDSSAAGAAATATTGPADAAKVDDLVAALSAMPGVAVAERDSVSSIQATQSTPTKANLWGLNRIDQRALPLDSSYTYPDIGGAGATVYVIDTGIRTTHTEFEGRATFGYNAIASEAAADLNGHGTHCAGIAAGKTYGVAKKANLVAVKVLSKSGSGSTSGIIAGINWAINDCKTNHAGNMCVFSLSLGGSSSSALNAAVNTAFNNGIVVVVAAGNSRADACRYSPAGAANVLTIGASNIVRRRATTRDVRSSFSNYGTCVELFAPGTSIKSSVRKSDTATAVYSGTSMATPFVAGSAALLWSTLGSATTAATVRSQVIANSTAGVIDATSIGTGSPNKLLFVGA